MVIHVIHETIVCSISGYSQLTLEPSFKNKVANDGMHPLLQTISAMLTAYREIIGVCCQLPQLHELQSLANEIYNGMVTVPIDGSVWSGDGTYL
jgi:hypothetical protein